MRLLVIFSSIFLGAFANALDQFTFRDSSGNNGVLSIEVTNLLKCNESPLLELGMFTYKGSTRSFKACWDQYRLNEKVIVIVASNTIGSINFTGQLILNPEYLKSWGNYTKFENSQQSYGCEKDAGGFFSFGNGIEEQFVTHFICFDH